VEFDLSGVLEKKKLVEIGNIASVT